MEVALATALIGAVASLAGAAVGGLAAYKAATLATTVERDANREQHIRARQEEAARTCLEALRAYQSVPQDRANNRLTVDGGPEWESAESAFAMVPAEAAKLPDWLRLRIIEAYELMRHADEMGSNARHGWKTSYLSIWAICRHAVDDVNTCVSAFLTGREAPQRPAVMIELEVAKGELYEYKEDEFAMEIDESREERREWLDARPDLRRRLEQRGDELP